jgi:AcrR family transcriptional regulator
MKTDETRPAPPRRGYHAPIRREQAGLTRRRILEAARALFAERGYATTTVEAIAGRAEVAVPTLYAAFGSKRQILASLVTQLKDAYAVPDRVRVLLADPDPRRQLEAAARITREFAVAAWDVIAVLDAARQADPELTELWDQVEGARLRDQQALAAQFAAAGVLKPGLKVAQAGDIFWAMSGHDLYHRLVIERGWSADQYERWLLATLTDLLLR